MVALGPAVVPAAVEPVAYEVFRVSGAARAEGGGLSRLPVLPERLFTEPFRRLRELGLPPGDLLICGSAPLYIRGLRDRITDLDVVARGRAWERALTLGTAHRTPIEGSLSIRPLDGRIEITDEWYVSLLGEVDRLFDRADVFGGLYFLSLADTIAWKRHLGRDKDLEDLRRLAERVRAAGLEVTGLDPAGLDLTGLDEVAPGAAARPPASRTPGDPVPAAGGPTAAGEGPSGAAGPRPAGYPDPGRRA
ncbi:hypothetical protein ACIBCM_12820 [Streptomyces sp. NPDC051018]|uniref:hypothetical protein n=1 Tax=Streptomyces sp. NPDC051018 TaxID=3365639 RepID=UPI0037B85830